LPGTTDGFDVFPEGATIGNGAPMVSSWMAHRRPRAGGLLTAMDGLHVVDPDLVSMYTHAQFTLADGYYSELPYTLLLVTADRAVGLMVRDRDGYGHFLGYAHRTVPVFNGSGNFYLKNSSGGTATVDVYKLLPESGKGFT